MAWPLPNGQLLFHWAAGCYQGDLAQLIRRAKFRGSWGACLTLQQSIRRISRSGVLVDRPTLVPIPPDPNRLGQRGLHLPSLVAEAAARATGLSIDRRSLRATGTRAQQAQLGRAARLAREPLGYLAHPRLRNVQVILVDDVLTTGMTLQSAAETLSSQGAEVIGAIVLARPCGRPSPARRETIPR